MTDNEHKNRLALDRLATSLVDDILSMSDEELLAEARADGDDPKELAQTVQNILDRAIATCGKAKLAMAKKAVLESRQRHPLVSYLDPVTARRKLDEILTKYPETHSKLTLAARKGEGLSDNDVLSMLRDLEELGLISPIGEQDGKQ